MPPDPLARKAASAASNTAAYPPNRLGMTATAANTAM
jgi:hypothetical protein